MSNKMYDVLKWIVVLVLPATATAYTGLSAIWGWPYSEAIPETLTLVATFLGTILMISSAQYKKKA